MSLTRMNLLITILITVVIFMALFITISTVFTAVGIKSSLIIPVTILLSLRRSMMSGIISIIPIPTFLFTVRVVESLSVIFFFLIAILILSFPMILSNKT